MAKIASKVAERISSGLKKFQPILESARTRDVNESDTVVIVTDMLQEVLGYDKYTEITSSPMAFTSMSRVSLPSHLDCQVAVSTADRVLRAQGQPRQASGRLCSEPGLRVGALDQWDLLAGFPGGIREADPA